MIDRPTMHILPIDDCQIYFLPVFPAEFFEHRAESFVV